METAEIEYVKDSFPDYLSKKDFISSSDIKNFLKSPAYYHFKKFTPAPEDEEEKRNLFVGTAIHNYVLEHECFYDNYCIGKRFDMRTTVGKVADKEFRVANAGKEVLYEAEYEMIKRIGDNALKNPTLVELIKDSIRELSIYTSDPVTGLKIRLRPDVFCEGRPTIVDLKSCLNSSEKGFRKDVWSYSYFITAAFYMDFSGKKHYVFCALEKNEPYPVTLFDLSRSLLDMGRRQYRMALDLIKFCQDRNEWPAYDGFKLMQDLYQSGGLGLWDEAKNDFDGILTIGNDERFK